MSVLAQLKTVHVEAEKKSDRPPLLLLHGIGNGAWIWERDQKRMSELGFSSFAVNLPGHGPDVGGNPSLDEVRDVVLQAVEELGEPPCVIGHSMGGLIAQMVASEAELHSMVLVNSAAPKQVSMTPQKHHIGPALQKIVPVLLGRNLDLRGRHYRDLGFNCVPEEDKDELEAKLSPWPNKLTRQMVFSRPEVVSKPCPVLVTCGLKDRVISFRVARLLGDFHHNAITWRFDDLGHFPQVEPGGLRLIEAALEWVANPTSRKVLEIKAFRPDEGVGDTERKRRTPHPERSDSRFKGRFKSRD